MKNKPTNNHWSGFTLIELLVGIFVVSISVLALYQMFVTGRSMLTEEEHRRLALEKCQSRMEVAQSYGIANEPIPDSVQGTFYEDLVPPLEGRPESGIQAVITVTVSESDERNRDTGNPIYECVTLQCIWQEYSGRDQQLVLKSYF